MSAPLRGRPSEAAEQSWVVAELRRARLLFCAVPNGGSRGGAREAAGLKRGGVVAGVPDLLIFTPPPLWPGARGTALEMKRTGLGYGAVSEEQRGWLGDLNDLGWYVVVGYGAQDALKKLKAVGYLLLDHSAHLGASQKPPPA